MEMLDIVKKLVGDIKPIGETNTDNERLQNLKEMCELTRNLLEEINIVCKSFPNNHEFSIKRSCKYGNDFLVEVGFKTSEPSDKSGIDLYFEDLTNWEKSCYCKECSSDINDEWFFYTRRIANGDCFYCNNCKVETVINHRPNEDNY